MSYTDMADFVFGEQPSASRWNDLIRNDEGFNDGSGILSAAITPAKLAADAGTSWAEQAYTPTWTATGTAPAIGNGTLTGHYSKIGRLIYYKIRWVAGSTTTFGTGQWSFALPPFTAGSNSLSATKFYYVGGGTGIRTGTLTFPVAPNFQSTTVVNPHYFGVSGAIVLAGSITNTSPHTWVNTDELFLWGLYQATT